MNTRRCPGGIQTAISGRSSHARAAIRAGDDNTAWRLLEAHILSQPWPFQHVKVHKQMLGLALRRRLPREIVAETWETKYPAMVKSWVDTWDDFIPFLEFPVELRTIVYSTNAIESLNARFRKAAVRCGHFPTEKSALKVLYLTAIERRKNRTNPTGRINSWKTMLNTLAIHYGVRLATVNN